MSSPADLIDALMGAWNTHLVRKSRKQEKGSEPWQPPNVWASRIKPCARAMALDMLHPEDDDSWSPAAQERMEQGNESEEAMISRLRAAGPFCSPPYRVIEQQHRFEFKDRDGEKILTGKMDGRLQFEGGPRPPIELKSGRSYESCKTVEDLERSTWGHFGLDQMLAYLLGAAEPWGLVLIRRYSDLPHPVVVELEPMLARAEAFVQRCRAAFDARWGKGPLPPFIEDVRECRKCPHLGKSCDAPLDYGAGLKVIADENLLQLAEEHEATQDAAFRNRKAWDGLTEALRGVEQGILGPFEIRGSWSAYSRLELPPELKKQYTKTDPKGRFTLKIERVGGGA